MGLGDNTLPKIVPPDNKRDTREPNKDDESGKRRRSGEGEIEAHSGEGVDMFDLVLVV